MTSRDEQVLEMAFNAFTMSRKITDPVDFHKRYQVDDQDDPHGRLIEFVHQTGSVLFGPAR
jgi:hypothetical protein